MSLLSTKVFSREFKRWREYLAKLRKCEKQANTNLFQNGKNKGYKNLNLFISYSFYLYQNWCFHLAEIKEGSKFDEFSVDRERHIGVDVLNKCTIFG